MFVQWSASIQVFILYLPLLYLRWQYSNTKSVYVVVVSDRSRGRVSVCGITAAQVEGCHSAWVLDEEHQWLGRWLEVQLPVEAVNMGTHSDRALHWEGTWFSHSGSDLFKPLTPAASLDLHWRWWVRHVTDPKLEAKKQTITPGCPVTALECVFRCLCLYWRPSTTTVLQGLDHVSVPCVVQTGTEALLRDEKHN